MRLLANLHKQIIRRLDHVSQKTQVFANIGFLEKILEGQNKMNGGDRPPLHLSLCNFSQFGVFMCDKVEAGKFFSKGHILLFPKRHGRKVKTHIN